MTTQHWLFLGILALGAGALAALVSPVIGTISVAFFVFCCVKASGRV
ncbi:MAG: hypothetical protein AAGL96_13330 [Pseudomonadota bacterium]